MKGYTRVPVFIVIAGIVLAGCTKEPLNNLSQEESRIYITNHDSAAVFSSYKTFSISDSVAIISNNQLQEKTLDSYDTQMIADIVSAMKQRGYTQVTKDQNPDLGINVNNIINTYTGYVDYSDYYGGYYGYWDPGYWGYPGYSYYGSYIGVYEVNEGVISIDMFDLKSAVSSGKISSVWNGVLRGSGIFDSANIDSMIKALFDQSAYIKANQ